MLNSHSRDMEAQLFGAGSLYGDSARRRQRVTRTIKKILRHFEIAVVSEDIGGRIGRKIIFDTYSGDVLVLKTNKVRRGDWSSEYRLGTRRKSLWTK